MPTLDETGTLLFATITAHQRFSNVYLPCVFLLLYLIYLSLPKTLNLYWKIENLEHVLSVDRVCPQFMQLSKYIPGSLSINSSLLVYKIQRFES